jgi:DNA-binding NtrC family response regulator
MKNGLKIFVVEDDPVYSNLLVHQLKLNPDHEVKAFSNGKGLLKSLNEKPDIVTLDINLPDIDGERVLLEIKKNSPNTNVLIVSGQEDVSKALDLLNKGAVNYIVKNSNTKNRLWVEVNRINETISLKNQIQTLNNKVASKYDFSESIKGVSKPIQSIFKILHKAIDNNSITVSISGETGTGKELIAKAIHYNSVRKKEPFVAINVTAVPKDLVESELFGHERGSFTGADLRRKGKFEEAGKGTIFLDEIGEMDLNLQTRLLRVLQEMEVVRVGGNQPVKLNCRVIVATHKNLAEEVKKENFRQDLYYRVLGLPILLPPLRDRKEDVLILAKYFLKDNENKKQKILSEAAKQKLLNYSYPGNIRELKAIVDLAIVLSDGNQITEKDINFPIIDNLADLLNEELSMREYEIKIIQHYLKKFDNNIPKTAEILKIGKSTIYRILKKSKGE